MRINYFILALMTMGLVTLLSITHCTAADPIPLRTSQA